MKRTRLITILGLITFVSFQLKAQVPLPYSSGFDDANQKNGWTEYKKASTQFSHWTYASTGAHSAPNCVGHDYSPSTGITLTDNWFVSPGFAIPTGGKLDSLWYSFSGFSTPAEGDTIGIYLLNGSQDPAAATSKVLLFDFRGSEYLADGTYRAKSNITLPPSSGLSYIALRYRNTDCSSKWLTTHMDNIRITGGSVGLNNIEKISNTISVYPNPSAGTFRINHSMDVQSISVQNDIGQTVYQSFHSDNQQSVEIDLSDKPKGMYIITVKESTSLFTQKVVVY
ncbi:MAG: T9SS type A sorting domain-containing protein [Bacteroidota bacterium]